MWKVFVFSVILSLSCASSHAQLGINNGINAEEGEFKFVVSIRKNGSYLCGGSILNKRYVLTAAQCVCNDNGVPQDIRNFAIHYGSVNISSERSVSVSYIACNNSNSQQVDEILFNDVAVVKLVSDLPDDKTWEPVKLLEKYNSSIESQGVIVGWGYLTSKGPYAQILQKLVVDIYDDTVCRLVYMPEQHLCLGATIGGGCYGDVGSPLLTSDNYQIGFAAYGTFIMCEIATEDFPNVYTRIDYFYDWIKDNSKI